MLLQKPSIFKIKQIDMILFRVFFNPVVKNGFPQKLFKFLRETEERKYDDKKSYNGTSKSL